MMHKKKLLVRLHLSLLILLLCSAIFSITDIATSTVEKANAADTNLSYISVPISSNDTLWSIAQEYYTDYYGSISNYIKEIKRCNSLTSDDIYAGNNIIVPLYIKQRV